MSFNMRMLTLAREAESLTQSALAHALGVSQSLISQLEHGLDEPDEVLLARMAQELHVPEEFLLQPDQPIAEGLVDFFHRRRRTLPAKPLRRAHAVANIIRLEVIRLLGTVELKEVAPLPVFPSDEVSAIEAAQMVRATWRLQPGPIPNLVQLIEAAGVPVVLCDLGHEKLSAISMPGPNGRHIVLVNHALPPSHIRFALAHELGHLVMHTGQASTGLEAEADQFASELLMPASDIERELQDLKFHQLGDLKRKWFVSMAALIRTAWNLDAITERQYRYMNMQLNKLPNGRKREPGEFAYEEPRLVAHVIDHFRSALGYTLAQVAKVMVTLEETVRVRYLGEVITNLRPIGASGRNLIQLPVPPAS